MNINIKTIKNLTQSEDEGSLDGSVPKKEKAERVTELRQDIVTDDWVVIATGRAKRPHEFGKVERFQDDVGIEKCLFEDPVASEQEKDVLIYHKADGEWTLRVFPNKFPAFSRGKAAMPTGEGPYFSMPGVGYHEIIVTRDHYRQLAIMDTVEVAEVFDAYQDRYLDLMNRKSVNYIAIFHNHGKEAGASIAHPHSQLVAIPVVSPYIQLELDGSERYFRAHKECVYCTMIEYEMEVKKRVVFENEHFIAFCPFASRSAFEIWVAPKKHSPYFERTNDEQKVALAEVFRTALKALYDGINDQPYNFYIHTSPCDGRDYQHYHWHIEILPHTAVWAGFELDTGIEISSIQPEVAAEFLRSNIK